MARKSAAALSVVRSIPDARPDVPAGLSDAEVELWTDIVDSKPGDWFGPDSMPVLKEYVRASIMCDLLDAKVKDAMQEGDAGDVKMLLDLRDKESRRAVSLATKLRLTQQSRYGARSADRADKRASGARPWQK